MIGGCLGGMFRDIALGSPNAIAIADGARRVPYAELNVRINRLSSALLASGCEKRDRVAILAENRREYVEVMLACAKLGLIAACLNWRQSPAELAASMSLVEPRYVFVSDRFATLLADSGTATDARCVRFGETYETLLSSGGPTEPQIEVDPEDGLLILYTSGTTGRSKGALISHRAMIARGTMMRADWSIRRSDGFIAWSPLFHMASADPTLGCLCQGSTVAIVDGFQPDRIADALVKYDVGWFVLMPGMIERMADELEARGTKVKRVAAAGCMANLVPPEQIARISRLLDAPFLNSFGSSETGIAPCSGNWIPSGQRPHSLGKLQTSCCEIKLVDENDRTVAPGDVGEICLRTPLLFSEYWNNPLATAEAFRGGWYHMGDDFYRAEDGTLHFADRRKYLIKSGGENIYPAEIEQILRASDKIAEAIVVKRADAHWGEVPVVFVVPAIEGLDATQVLSLLDGRVARYKLPKAVLLIREEDLQRNSTGKVQREPLEARASGAT